MGLYNVVAPCVVEVAGRRLHHMRPTTAPIEVDDAVAAPLVETGKLEPFGSISGDAGAILKGVQRTVADLGGEFAEAGQQAADDFTAGIDVVESEPEKPAPRPRRPRRGSED